MVGKEIAFDWEYELVYGLGNIFRPYVPIQLKTKEAGWKHFDFIVDTGADITMLPYYMAEILGVDLEKAQQDEFTGIGGHKVNSWKTTIQIKIVNWEFKIRAAFTSDNLTPLLLGRVGTLDRKFSWIFDHKRKKIIFRR